MSVFTGKVYFLVILLLIVLFLLLLLIVRQLKFGSSKHLFIKVIKLYHKQKIFQKMQSLEQYHCAIGILPSE